MIFTWANLLILFLLLKKFLFKPVTKILDERAEEIENSYKQAEETNDKALSLKSEYEEKLLSAKNEADGIIKSAVETADRRSESIVNEANEKVRYIMEKSQKQIESIAGIPTCKIGIVAKKSFGIHESITLLRLAKPPYTSDVITRPAAILPK